MLYSGVKKINHRRHSERELDEWPPCGDNRQPEFRLRSQVTETELVPDILMNLQQGIIKLTISVKFLLK